MRPARRRISLTDWESRSGRNSVRVFRWLARSLTDWESRSGRNLYKVRRDTLSSLTDWESRSGRNYRYSGQQYALSLTDWESRSGRNHHRAAAPAGCSLTDWESRSGRNNDSPLRPAIRAIMAPAATIAQRPFADRRAPRRAGHRPSSVRFPLGHRLPSGAAYPARRCAIPHHPPCTPTGVPGLCRVNAKDLPCPTPIPEPASAE